MAISDNMQSNETFRIKILIKQKYLLAVWTTAGRRYREDRRTLRWWFYVWTQMVPKCTGSAKHSLLPDNLHRERYKNKRSTVRKDPKQDTGQLFRCEWKGELRARNWGTTETSAATLSLLTIRSRSNYHLNGRTGKKGQLNNLKSVC